MNCFEKVQKRFIFRTIIAKLLKLLIETLKNPQFYLKKNGELARDIATYQELN